MLWRVALRVLLRWLAATWRICIAGLVVGAVALGAEPSTETAPEWQVRGKLELPAPYTCLWSVVFSPDSKWFAAACADAHWVSEYSPAQGAVALVDSHAAKVRRVLRTEEVGTPEAIAFTADSRRVVGSWYYGTTLFWDCRTGELMRALKGPPDAGHMAAMSPDARIGAWSCADGKIHVWDLAARKPMAAFEAGHFDLLAVSGDGKRIAAAMESVRLAESHFSLDMTQPGEATVWQAHSGVRVAALKGHAKRIHCLAFSPKADMIATGDEDGVVRLWRLPFGIPLRSLKAHADVIEGLGFSPDGKMLATGASFDSKVKVWDTSSGLIVASLRLSAEEEGTGMPHPVAFSPDGKILAAAEEGGTIAFWEVPPARRPSDQSPAR